GERWGEAYDLMGGNAGIGLGALRLGDPELALLAVEPYLHTSERTAYGITWENRVGLTARRHHISHGTLGIAYGLVAVGGATGRSDLVDLGLEAVADVVARNEEPDGFLVPHSDPAQVHPLLERYSLGWCHGPTGDAQVFRLLHEVTGQARWLELQDRCWHTVVTSGLPERLRRGFWDNNGRCCGTA
ncbi:lanthionine synthetase LanC family protein, partial [Nocardioides hankookensis]